MRKNSALRRAIAEVIKEERIAQGLSRRALSKRLGEYDGYIREIEVGSHSVRVDEFVVIAEALGLAPSRLLVQVTRKAKGKS